MAKAIKTATPATSKKLTDAERVENYMNSPGLLFKAEINSVRSIIRKTNKDIGERIKWNAPSYHYKGEDMVTFNAWAKTNVHLVFHHPAIVKVKSSLLQGEYKDRRMVYFADMKAIRSNKKELERIMKELTGFIDK